jgi:predicted AlkP superfamily phosphohydrolase/phosphomutase
VSKIILIGIDGLDPVLLKEWRNILPNFNSLFNDISDIIMESTFPPDSIAAWTSIYTGENPAEHGLIESIDYLSGRNADRNEDRSAYFRGRTFWDEVGSSGRSVCVINPFVAYPAWKVNGIMVSGPVFESGAISAYPEDILTGYDFPHLGGMVDFPDEKDFQEFLTRTQISAKKLAEVSLKIYRDYLPDLFFVSFLTLDRVKHFLWRFTDSKDIYYPGETLYKDVIKHSYVLYDSIVGRFREELASDSLLLVISDHGHRRRCMKCLNLNELLRREGYLATGENGVKGACKKLLERMKVFTIKSLSEHGYQDWIYKIAKYIPYRKALKKSTYLIDKGRSSVTLANLCGTNPYGGVDIRMTTKEEYENLRERISEELMSINKTMGENIVKWVKRREHLYRGKYEENLPDLLFELDEEYGIGMDLYTDLITKNYSHMKISGGHKREAVFLMDGCNEIKNIQRPATVQNIKDYIIEIISK